MPLSRRGRRIGAFRKKISSYRRRKTFGVRARNLLRRRFSAKRRTRFVSRRSTSRRRSSKWGGLRKRFSSRRGGSRRVLRYSKSAQANTNIAYRGSYKRPFKVNRKFGDKVAESLGHTYSYTDVNNASTNAAISQAGWGTAFIGLPVQFAQLMLALQENSAGYGMDDPNTSAGGVFRYKFRARVHKMYRKLTFMNGSDHSINVELYEMTPRYDFHPGGAIPANYDPLAMLITQEETGDLPLIGGTTMGYLDPRFSIWKCPYITTNWKIYRVRKFSVHGGASFTATISVNNKIISQHHDCDPDISHLAHKTKCLMWKITGPLGIAQNTNDDRLIRNLDAQVVFKIEDNWEAHLLHDSRKVVEDNNLGNNAGTFGNGLFRNEETLGLQSTDLSGLVPSGNG